MPLQFQIEVFSPTSPVHPSSCATSVYSDAVAGAATRWVLSAEPLGGRRAEVILKSSEQQVLPPHQVNCLKKITGDSY